MVKYKRLQIGIRGISADQSLVTNVNPELKNLKRSIQCDGPWILNNDPITVLLRTPHYRTKVIKTVSNYNRISFPLNFLCKLGGEETASSTQV